MGMYTEIHFNAELKQDVPANVLHILRYMLGDVDVKPRLPEHALFKTSRWNFMLCCDSYYFAADTHSTLRYDDIGKSFYLCIRSNVKNYDNEIELFIDWIMPYITGYKGDFLGFSRYEEFNEPTLIYYPKEKE